MTKHRTGQLGLELDAQRLHLPDEVMVKVQTLLQQMLREVVGATVAGESAAGDGDD